MIFDTNIFIYANRGEESARDLLLGTETRAISAVTYMEYVPFCRDKRELASFEKLLKSLRFEIYDIDLEISMSARMMVKQLALGHSVEMADALIAATSIKHADILCTSNAKHFRPIAGLELNLYEPTRPPPLN